MGFFCDTPCIREYWQNCCVPFFHNYATYLPLPLNWWNVICNASCRMDTKDAATKAIIATHGTQINGYTCKCSWGKETDSSGTSQNRSAQQQNSAYPQAPASYIFTCLHLLDMSFGCILLWVHVSLPWCVPAYLSVPYGLFLCLCQRERLVAWRSL